MTAASVRPWIGPIPKVSLNKLTLADCIHPSAWMTVRNKKKRIPPETAATAPAIEIAEI